MGVARALTGPDQSIGVRQVNRKERGQRALLCGLAIAADRARRWRYGFWMSDAPESPRTPILASDADREHSVMLLRDAVVEGRLTLEEFSERIDVVYAARTDLELSSLVRDLPSSQHESAPPAAVAEAHRAVFSHLTRAGLWSLPRRSAWRSIFGTIDLDLCQVRLAGPETLLEVYNLFGTVRVIVPEGIEVIVRGGGLLASQKIDSPARPPVAGGPRLTIDTRGPGGTLYVRTRPNPMLKDTSRQPLER
jgi:hypothetical protein